MTLLWPAVSLSPYALQAREPGAQHAALTGGRCRAVRPSLLMGSNAARGLGFVGRLQPSCTTTGAYMHSWQWLRCEIVPSVTARWTQHVRAAGLTAFKHKAQHGQRTVAAACTELA